MIPSLPALVTSDEDPSPGKGQKLTLPLNPPFLRCRLGDVVRVVGTYNQCPVVRFTCR